MKLYFAYGSNLSKKQMRKRCPGSVPVAAATLTGWRWLIGERGYATLAACKGATVHGALYLLTPSDELALDICEGVRTGAYGKFYLTVECEGVDTRALVYIDPRTLPGAPRADYIKRCVAGAKAWELPRKFVRKMASTRRKVVEPELPLTLAP